MLTVVHKRQEDPKQKPGQQLWETYLKERFEKRDEERGRKVFEANGLPWYSDEELFKQQTTSI